MISSPGERAAPERAGQRRGVIVPRMPRIAIIGSPNVGKSTLFNALLGRRRSITHSEPGVTRDPVEAECSIGTRRFLLVDTGGYTSRSLGRRGRGTAAALDSLVVERSLRSARESDLVLLVLDARRVTAEDEEFISSLRPLSEKIILVVNKVDTPNLETLAWNAYVHGFPRVIGVSAAHSRNLDELRELIVWSFREPPAATDEAGSLETPVRIAILGKPNTGKSTLANRLTGREGSIVSKDPGTTRDVIESRFVYRRRSFQLLDTAGIRRKSRVHEPIEYYSVNRAIESIHDADMVFLLVDAVLGLADQDKKIASQAVKEGKGIVLVLNKWDMLEKKPGLFTEASGKIRFHFPVLGFAPIVPVSALTGAGIRKLLATALEVRAQLQRRVGTGRLNAALSKWVAHYPLPVRGRNYKIRFAAQISVNPVRFMFFVNRIAGFPLSYTRYLENRIRQDLGFPLVPVSIELRQSGKGQT